MSIHLSCTKHFIPNYIKRDIATAPVDLVTDCGDIIAYNWYAHGTRNQVHRELVADNDKLRYILRVKRNEHVTERRQNLCALTPDSRAKLHKATLTFEHFSDRTPRYLNHLLVRNGSSSHHPNDIRISFRPRNAHDNRAFSYSANQFWYSLPGEIKNSETLNPSKVNLKHFLRTNQNNNN